MSRTSHVTPKKIVIEEKELIKMQDLVEETASERDALYEQIERLEEELKNKNNQNETDRLTKGLQECNFKIAEFERAMEELQDENFHLSQEIFKLKKGDVVKVPLNNNEELEALKEKYLASTDSLNDCELNLIALKSDNLKLKVEIEELRKELEGANELKVKASSAGALSAGASSAGASSAGASSAGTSSVQSAESTGSSWIWPWGGGDSSQGSAAPSASAPRSTPVEVLPPKTTSDESKTKTKREIPIVERGQIKSPIKFTENAELDSCNSLPHVVKVKLISATGLSRCQDGNFNSPEPMTYVVMNQFRKVDNKLVSSSISQPTHLNDGANWDETHVCCMDGAGKIVFTLLHRSSFDEKNDEILGQVQKS